MCPFLNLLDLPVGHHVRADPGLDRGPVKAVSPVRGWSEAESLDRTESSRRIKDVMAQVVVAAPTAPRGVTRSNAQTAFVPTARCLRLLCRVDGVVELTGDVDESTTDIAHRRTSRTSRCDCGSRLLGVRRPGAGRAMTWV
jgi:hypothetical protein